MNTYIKRLLERKTEEWDYNEKYNIIVEYLNMMVNETKRDEMKNDRLRYYAEGLHDWFVIGDANRVRLVLTSKDEGK